MYPAGPCFPVRRHGVFGEQVEDVIARVDSVVRAVHHSLSLVRIGDQHGPAGHVEFVVALAGQRVHGKAAVVPQVMTLG
jgi:hypothetical protein